MRLAEHGLFGLAERREAANEKLVARPVFALNGRPNRAGLKFHGGRTQCGGQHGHGCPVARLRKDFPRCLESIGHGRPPEN